MAFLKQLKRLTAELGFGRKAEQPNPSRRAILPYEGASMSRRAAGWQTADYGPNVNQMSVRTLRARARQMVRNNPWISNAIDVYASELIGTGIKPKSQHKNPKIREAINAAFLRWTDEADADQRLDFYGLQALIAREEFEAGEVFARFRPRRPEDGLSVPLQIQIIESDLCPIDKTESLASGNKIKCGIELDKLENPVAYWMYREHPGDISLRLDSDMTTHPVPASEIMHICRNKRAGQLRGETHLAPVLTKVQELATYDDAEVVRKKSTAMYAVFFQREIPGDEPLPFPTQPGINPVESEMGFVAQTITPMEPGLTQVVPPGWKVEFSQPAEVGASYEPFMRTQLMPMAAALWLTYDQMTGDLSNVNFSSQRAGLLTNRRRMEQFQHQVVVFQFCRRVWVRWMETAVLAGAIEGVSAQMYNADKAEFERVDWRPAAWPWVDPVKDAQAEKMLVRAGFKSRASVVSERGEDVEGVDAEVEEDNKRADEKGLIYDSDARQTSMSGGTGKSERVDSNPDAQPVNGAVREDARSRGRVN